MIQSGFLYAAGDKVVRMHRKHHTRACKGCDVGCSVSAENGDGLIPITPSSRQLTEIDTGGNATTKFVPSHSRNVLCPGIGNLHLDTDIAPECQGDQKPRRRVCQRKPRDITYCGSGIYAHSSCDICLLIPSTTCSPQLLPLPTTSSLSPSS